MNLTTLVLTCKDIHATELFYKNLGLLLVLEQHEKGPQHFSTKLDNLVLEFYPSKSADPIAEPVKFELNIPSAVRQRLVDPDGRTVWINYFS